MTKFLKRCWLAFAILIISAAIISSIFRALTPWAKQYKGQVEHHLSVLLGEPVTINAMETGWYWFEPVIKLHQVNIAPGKKTILHANKLLVGINLWRTLWHWQIQPGILYIDDLHLSLRQTVNSWQIEGLPISDSPVDFASSPILAWILMQQKIIIKNVAAEIHLNDGTLLPINQFNLSIVNRAGRYRIKGSAWVEPMQTRLQVLANLSLDPYQLASAKGQLFFAATHLLPAKWQRLFPQSRIDLQSGLGDIQLWADIAQGHWQTLQTTVNFQQLAWKDRITQKKQAIEEIKANLAWNANKEGWQLTGDRVKFRIANMDWPENSFMIRYQQAQQDYFVFLKDLELNHLLALPLPWPQTVKPILAMKPTGSFHDLQVHIREQGINYLLAGFSELGWQARGLKPAVSNFSGAIRWSPREGRLEIDGKTIAIAVKNKPPIHLAALGEWNWKKTSEGLRVSMPHLAVLHPNLGINAQGSLEEVSANSWGKMHMKGEFSAKQAQQWLSYLPNNYLKPKLAAWLKNDIKQIANLMGEFHVEGSLADFPFDKEPGEFVINTSLSGVDLFFAPDWPLTRNIAGLLQINKRTLMADIAQARFNEMDIERGNLRITHLGADHEVLFFHGKMATTSDKARNYVLASPLKNKLFALNGLQMEGPLKVDLQLEIPLYTEVKEVKVVGSMDFRDNHIQINHPLNTISLNELDGSLQFNQQGIVDSQFKAVLFSTPVDLRLKSISKGKSYTQVTIKGNTNTSILGKSLTIPSFMEGELALESTIKLFDDPQMLSRLQLQSSLQGLKINLPPPLGKTAEAKTPFTADIAFNEDKMVGMEFNYDNRLKASKSTTNEWAIDLNQREFVGKLVYQPASNSVKGEFTKLHLNNDLLGQNLTSLESNLKPSELPNLDLQVASFQLGELELGELNLKTTAHPSHWQVDYGVIKAPFYQLIVKGQWQKTSQVNATQLQADLRINNLAKSLTQLKITPVIEANRGDIRFEGGWQGPFYAFSLPKVSGRLAISLRNGRITHLGPETEEKIGLGKLLSILSLQTIPRRIKLDFSDLSQDGYSFDEFKGSLTLSNGIMSTQDGYINGPVAHASIKGQLDIIKQLCDIKLRVSPHITASLPIVATIAGGPVAGIAAWAASKIINQGMQKISGYTYRISGPWQQPDVQHINIIKPKRT